MDNIKSAWVDDTKKIVSFHQFENGVAVLQPVSIFWQFVMGLIEEGYKVL